MIYALAHFADATVAVREVDPVTGAILRYCDEAGNTLDRTDIPTFIGEQVFPDWALPDPAPVVSSSTLPRRMSKLDFVALLGDNVFTALLGMAHQSIDVEKFVKMIDWATPDSDGTSIDRDDPRVQKIVELEPALVAQGIVSEGWAQGVLDA